MIDRFVGNNNDGKALHVSLEVPEVIGKLKDSDLLIKKIVSDILNLNISTSDVLFAKVEKIDENTISYSVDVDPLHRTHKIAISKLDDKEIAKEVKERAITQEHQSLDAVLERYAEFSPPLGVGGTILYFLSRFFKALLNPLRTIIKIYEAIATDRPQQKKLKYDLAVLAEVCGRAMPHQGLTMHQALKYMAKMLEREQGKEKDLVLEKRINRAVHYSKEIKDLRNSFSEGKFERVVKELQSHVGTLQDEKMLIPVAYFDGHKTVEMLLEISKDQSASTYNVALISESEEVRSLFDLEMHLQTGSQSLRREISGINKEELLARISSWVELQSSPGSVKSNRKNLFLQSLRFDKSMVMVGKVTEAFKRSHAPGHLLESISYLKEEKGQEEKTKQFEVATRLRFFLDVARNNLGNFKNKEFWLSVRTTGMQMAQMIEENREALELDSVELSSLYKELKEVLETLDAHLPQLKEIADENLQLLSGDIVVAGKKKTPVLIPLIRKPNVLPDIKPPLAAFDAKKSVVSIVNWATRCKALRWNNLEFAAHEAKLMIRTLPRANDAIWEQLGSNDAQIIIEAFEVLVSVITENTKGKKEGSLHDIASTAALNLYACRLAKKIPESSQSLFLFSIFAKKVVEDIASSRIPLSERRWLSQILIDSNLPAMTLSNLLSLPSSLYFLYKMSQYTQAVLGLTPHMLMPKKVDSDELFNGTYQTPLKLRAPDYARDINHEITNRYLSEFCCLGCIRDNCENYNRVDKSQHRFHPLYMLHNYSEIFCDHLSRRGDLYRDEVSDLMYTQQTNQHAHTLFTDVHGGKHGFEIASGFDPEDRHHQLLNTFVLFLDHSHFFKKPDLRWQFELKLFCNDSFYSLLSNENYNEYKPFLISALTKLKNEIHVLKVGGEIEAAAYLIGIADELKQLISTSQLPEVEKELLGSFVNFDSDKLLSDWALDLLGKTEDHYIDAQKMVFSLLLSRYYKKFCDNPADPCFKNEKNLQLILTAVCRLESLKKGKEKIDPEVRDRYLALMAWVSPYAKARIEQDKGSGDFANSLLFHINSSLAAKRLKWSAKDYPTLFALDGKKQLYQFDLSTGIITLGEKRQEELTESLKNNKTLQRLFGEALGDEWSVFGVNDKVTNTTFALTHRNFPERRIVLEKPKEITVEQLIENPVTKNREWMAYVRFSEQDRFIGGLAASSLPDIPPAVAALIGDRDCFIDNAQSGIFVFEHDNPKVLYATIYLRDGIIDVELADKNLHLLSATEQQLEKFTSIEDSHFIQVIGKRQHAQTLSYIRYQLASSGAPLSYEIEKNATKIVAFPGFELESYGVRPGKKEEVLGTLPLPKTFDQFQLLKKDGKEIVLIPMNQLSQLTKYDGTALLQSTPLFGDSYGKVAVYDYRIDPETNRLIANGAESYAYLSYICFIHHDYESALYYLNKANTSTGYTQNFDKIFDWVSNIQDNTPSDIALKLHFELFREKVIQDYTLRNLQAGKLDVVQELALQKVNRLKSIASLYDKYMQTPPAGELLLEPEEELAVKALLKKFLQEHGDEFILSGEKLPQRADGIELQSYTETSPDAYLGLSSIAFNLWIYKGNVRSQSLLTMRDPKWILEGFQDLFNKILDLDPESTAFKQLEHQIRMLSEIVPSDQSSATLQAQILLLKLITVKKDHDPTHLEDLKAKLGPSGHLPSLSGALFQFSRIRPCNCMLVTATYFSQFALANKDLAKIVADELSHSVRWPTTRYQRQPTTAEIDAEAVGRSAVSWIEKYQGNEFEEDFRNFLLSEIFGGRAVAPLKTLDMVINDLRQVDIGQALQDMQSSSNTEPASRETYRERFEKLIGKEITAPGIEELSQLEEKTIRKIAPALVQENPVPFSAYLLGAQIENIRAGFKIDTSGAKPSINESVFDDLAKSQEPAFVRVAEDYRKDMRAALKEDQNVSITKGKAQQLKRYLERERASSEEEREKLKFILLQFVDQFKAPAATLALRRLLGEEKKPSLDLLIRLWRNEELKEWEVIDHKISQYLELTTKATFLTNLIKDCSSYIESCKTGADEVGDLQLASNLYDSVSTERHFSLSDPDFKDLLFIEYTQGIIMRRPQVETIRKMLTDPNSAEQLRMGGGKSKVLLPLLAKRKAKMANGTKLVMLMLPEELYETNCKDLDMTNRQLFDQKMHRFDFSRRTDRSVQSLEKIYERMLQTVKAQGFMMCTKRSMLSFRNAYIELFYNLQNTAESNVDARRGIIAQIRAMSRIYNLFQNHTDVLADEIDACLDVRKEVNFSLGKSSRIDPIKADICNELMELILQDRSLDELSVALRANIQAAISPERRTELLRVMIGKYYENHKIQLEKLGNEEAFVDYIFNEATQPCRDVEKAVFRLKESDNRLFKSVTSLKAFIEHGFKTTLGRVGDVNYGRDPQSGIWTIPYKASNTPNVGSEFDDDVEQITFTMQDYLQNGVSYKQVYQIIARMHKAALDELRALEADQMISINETKASQEFLEFMKSVDPQKKSGDLINLATMNTPKRIEALTAAINATAEGRVAFAHQCVARNIAQYSNQINSRSLDVADMVKNFSGFTGTPWNLLTFHDKIHAQKSLGVDGSTWALMLGRDNPIHTFDLDPAKPIDSLLEKVDVVGNYQAVIDTGAYFRGTGNREFIDKSFEVANAKKKTLEGGIYFDESGIIVKKVGVGDKALAIDVAPQTELMNNITLYDQAHTVGADIKQGRTAKALVTIGENTFIRDLFQAVWRLRQLHLEQRVSFAVSNSIKERILAGEKRELTTEDILKFCMMNEARRESEDNYRAEREKIAGFSKRVILPSIVEDIIHGECSDDAISSLATTFVSDESQLFIKVKKAEEAFDQYGILKAQEDPLEVHRQTKKGEVKKYIDLQERFNSLSEQTLLEREDEIGERGAQPGAWFPSRVESGLQEGSEVEQEAQAETEQEQELMLETEVEQETNVQIEVIVPIVQTGEAGHGGVNPLGLEEVKGQFERADYTHDAYRQVATSVEFFDPNIYVSGVFERNMIPAAYPEIPSDNPTLLYVRDGVAYYRAVWVRNQRAASTPRPSPQSVFYSNRKPVKNVVIGKQNGKWAMIIPTIHEAHGSCKEFIKKADPSTVQVVEVAISPSKPMVIYNNRKDRSGSLSFDSEEDSRQFYRLYVQAKLFNGEIDFSSKEEKEAVKAWIQEKGAEKFKQYFEENILAAKPRRFADRYPKSTLFKIFNELLTV